MAKKKKQGAVTGATKHSVSARDPKAVPSSRLDQDDPDTKSVRTIQPIVATINPGETGPQVANLQDALGLLLERSVIRSLDPPNSPTAEELVNLTQGLSDERAQSLYRKATQRLIQIVQLQQGLGDNLRGVVEEKTAEVLNRFLRELGGLDQIGADEFTVKGRVTLANGIPTVGFIVRARALNLRTFQALRREAVTDSDGRYEISYSREQFNQTEKGNADLVIRVFSPDRASDSDEPVVKSPTLFNTPLVAEVNLTVPVEVIQPPTPFENIGRAVAPHIGNLKVEELEEDKAHQDLSFLSGKTGIAKPTLGQFVLAHSLALHGIQAEFWFAMLGGSFFQFSENQSLKVQVAAILDSLSSLDAAAVRKLLTRGFDQKEIPDAFKENVADWVEAFLKFVASWSVSGPAKPTFVKLALEDAKISGAKKQETFARLFNEHKVLTPELLATLEQDRSFKKTEIADLRTSFRLAELTYGDFSVVKMLKEEFDVRQPEKIRTLAKKSESEWVNLVKEKHAAGDIKLPFEGSEIVGQKLFPAAEVYGKMLERQFREAFPTTAFAGGLERALQDGGAHGLSRAQDMGKFLEGHEQFELLKTPVDDFFKNSTHPDFRSLANDENFRLEVKAVQRVFKLAPTFEATNALLADNLHSSQIIYRMGESEFVRNYASRPGFTAESARLAWNRAADTHAAVLTLVVDLKSLEGGPRASQNDPAALSNFPNWDNLFKTGDLCDCEPCRSVLGPAAYFADLLMFLRDRRMAKPGSTDSYSAKDILFNRRPDLGYLELNCDNALTPLPYIDVVCEVLEDSVAAGENDIELPGFVAMPPVVVSATLNRIKTFLNLSSGNAEISLSQVDPADPYRWVMHTDNVTYLLKKKGPPTSNFFAEVLRNTKASAAELRAYPQYVNPKSYGKLRAAKFPLSLPFDLFAEEVRAAFQITNLQRWDLMRTLQGTAAPNNPTDGEIAAEYFSISVDTAALHFNGVMTAAQRTTLLTHPSLAAVTLIPAYQQAVQELFQQPGRAPVTGLPVGFDFPTAITGAPNNIPISYEPYTFDEKHLILHVDATVAGQQTVWGESGASWLNNVGNVKNFLQKTSLEYNELLTLLDLKFINPAGDISIHHLDPSCDLDMKVIQVIDETKLDQIHRFLRLWRKLPGWKMWELDLVIGHPMIGGGSIDEPFLINLFYFSEVRNKLGGNAKIEQVCALFDNLNTETSLTKLHEKRREALYQSLFLNKRLIHPLDTSFAVTLVNVLTPTVEKIATHQPTVLAALGIREADLNLLKGLTKVSNGTPYITDDLTLTNLSFLWRHAWLAKLLKFNAADWKTLLKIVPETVPIFANLADAQDFLEARYHIKAAGFTQVEVDAILFKISHRDVFDLACPKAALEFLEEIERLKATGFTLDELNWLLAADPTAKAALKEADAARFFATLRKDLQGILAEFTPAQYEFLAAATNEEALTGLLATLLQKLNREETAVTFFLKTLRGSVQLEASVQGLPAGFAVPTAITAAAPNGLGIPIQYSAGIFRFSGLMTDPQRTTLLTVTGNAAYQGAIEEFFRTPRLAVKFFEPVFTVPLSKQPSEVDFKSQLPDQVALKIAYDPEQRQLRFSGIMSSTEKEALLGLSGNTDFIAAVNSLAAQPLNIASTDGRVWLTDNDLDTTLPETDTYAKRLANAVRKALSYLSATSAENGVVRASSAQWGLTEALTRRLLTAYAVVPILPSPTPSAPAKRTLMALLTDKFTIDSMTFNSWFWANRVSAILKKWKITLTELERIDALKTGAQLLDFLTMPLDVAGTRVSLERFLRTNRLLKMRDSLPETEITLLEVLEKLNTGTYATAAAASNPAVTEQHLFAVDVEHLNEAWSSADVEAFTATLDLAYPTDYLRAENWERLRRAFDFLENLNASADTVKAFAATAMTDAHAKTVKELLRSKFGAETWLTLSADIQDALRERKRDALAAYLLTQPKLADAPSGKWENTNDLYAYYLLDVEMSSCQLTSRLVQASGSVQLFVQRCLMALEPDVVAVADGDKGDSAWRWWQWMRKYQVWVANRKVFLWPENWIEPELKKDRSPFFKDMENEMQQNDINQDTVETAFSNYLEKLDGVAQLEIAGFFQEDDGENAIVHVFGRTAGAEPHLYYYRRYDYRQWTPWEKVELDIQGDYLIPAVVNKRLFLFWPIFTEVSDEAGNNRMKVPLPGQKIFAPDQTRKKLRLQMAVSNYRQGKWTSKRVSKDFDESKSYTTENPRRNYQFFLIDQSNVDGRFVIQYDSRTVDMAAIEAALAAAQAVADSNLTSADADLKLANDASTAANTAVKAAANGFKVVGSYVALAEVLAASVNAFYNSAEAKYVTAKNTVSVIELTLNDLVASFGYDAGFLSDAADFKGLLGLILLQCQVAIDPTVTAADQTKAANWAKGNSTDAVVLAKVLHKTAQNVRDDIASDARTAARELRAANIKAKAAQTAVEALSSRLTNPNAKDFMDHAKLDAESASLSGAFEISGCTGAPEKTDFEGPFSFAAYPPVASVGKDTAFLKWVELTSRKSSTNDFILTTSLSAQYAPDTVVLNKTPDIFRMSPALHFSNRDKACRVADTSYKKVGSFLPFFYNDRKRTFFVLPSLLIPNQGYATYPKLEQYLSGYEILDPIAIRQYYLMSQRLRFTNFYHPFVCHLAKLVYNPLQGIPALMSRETQLKDSGFKFADTYQPNPSVVGLPQGAQQSYPTEQIDFSPDGAYSPYNWELFFHAPLLIANSLSKNQRFEEARDWYHFIFNPIGVESAMPGGSPMSKYWITKPFFQTTDRQYVQQRIDDILHMLAGDTNVPGYSTQAKNDLEGQVFDWRTNPFEPHRIANYRTVAYQKTVVMKYLDNLIAWGDNLFRQDSMESINEATQLYILAAEILGPAPKKIPPQVKPPVASFNELETELDKFSNALVQVENLVPMLSGKRVDGADRAPLPMLYFCVPQNDKMLGYWNLVADRLYKIRHCMNLEGVVRQLALFEPPIDPAALVKAIAGGVDISAALTDLNAPLPLYRFNVLLQKANEVCNDVKALGGALLAALEKKDAEAIGLLRQSQEIRLLEAVKIVREKQIEEENENLAGVKRSKELAEIKKKYYENKEFMNALENASAALAGGAIGVSGVLSVNEVLASIFFLLPSFTIGISGFGGSPEATAQWGSENIAKSIQSANSALQHAGSILSQSSSMVATTANYHRRKEEWDFQKDLAYKESEQIDRSIAATELRIAVAEQELANHVIQIDNARATD